MQQQQDVFKKGPSEAYAEKIKLFLGYLPKTLASQPTELADLSIKNIEVIQQKSVIPQKVKSIIQFALAVAQEDKYRRHKFALFAKAQGYTDEDLAYIIEVVSIMTQLTIFDVMTQRSEEELKNYKANLQLTIESLKNKLKLPNQYDVSKIQKPKNEFYGLSAENEVKAIEVYGVIPYCLNEMPSTYANFLFERMVVVHKYMYKIPPKDRMMIFYTVLCGLRAGQSQYLKDYFLEIMKIVQTTQEELAELTGTVMMEAYINVWVKSVDYDFDEYVKNWEVATEKLKLQSTQQQ